MSQLSLQLPRFPLEFILGIAFGEIVEVLPANLVLSGIVGVETLAEVCAPRVLRSDSKWSLHLIVIAGGEAANLLVLGNGGRIIITDHLRRLHMAPLRSTQHLLVAA